MVDEAVLAAARRLLADEQLGARITVVSGPSIGLSGVVDHRCDVLAGDFAELPVDDLMSDAAELMRRERSQMLGYGDSEVFVEILAPRPRLFVFGAVHIAQSLTVIAKHLGYHVTVSDARPAFTTEDRFPDADRLLVGWPDQVDLDFDHRSFVVVLSHDARFEDPLWPLVHTKPVRYIGAMGSNKTAAARHERLLASGWTADEVSMIHGPIGLDIGAQSPGEVAVAILGEMTEARYLAHQPLDLVGEIRRITRA